MPLDLVQEATSLRERFIASSKANFMIRSTPLRVRPDRCAAVCVARALGHSPPCPTRPRCSHAPRSSRCRRLCGRRAGRRCRASVAPGAGWRPGRSPCGTSSASSTAGCWACAPAASWRQSQWIVRPDLVARQYRQHPPAILSNSRQFCFSPNFFVLLVQLVLLLSRGEQDPLEVPQLRLRPQSNERAVRVPRVQAPAGLLRGVRRDVLAARSRVSLAARADAA